MAKLAELGDIVMSKDGKRMVLKLQAEELTVKAYDGTLFTLKKGDYINVASHSECIENCNFLLEREYINQDTYDQRVSYLEKISEGFRARLSVRAKK